MALPPPQTLKVFTGRMPFLPLRHAETDRQTDRPTPIINPKPGNRDLLKRAERHFPQASCSSRLRRLEDEERENQKRRDEIAELKCQLRQSERCAAELHSLNDCLKAELELMSTKVDKYQCETEAANQRLRMLHVIRAVVRIGFQSTYPSHIHGKSS